MNLNDVKIYIFSREERLSLLETKYQMFKYLTKHYKKEDIII